MLHSIALVAALATPKPVANAFLHDFAGSWICSAPKEPPSLWRIAEVRGSRWARVDWGIAQNGVPAGTAFVGYNPARALWLYRDFHGGGSYANLHGTRSADGTWTWAGPFYPYLAPHGSAPLQGRITWKRREAEHITRTFAALLHGKLVPGGADTCTAAKR